MGWDIFGQLVGKDRRRQIESSVQAEGAQLTQVKWGVLGTRLAAGVATGLLTATLHGSIPTTTGGLLTLAAGGLVAAGPAAFQAAGVFNAVSPGTISAAKAAAQGLQAILNAPKAQRQEEMQSAALAAITAWQAQQDALQSQAQQDATQQAAVQQQAQNAVVAAAPGTAGAQTGAVAPEAVQTGAGGV